MNEAVRIPGTNVTVANKAPLAAGGPVVSFVPQTLDECWRFAQVVVAGGFTPPGLKTAEAVMVAVMHGAEVGLTPFASVKNIAVINNRPTIWGDALPGIVRKSGVCEYIKETVTGEGDNMVASCEVKRTGEPAEIRTFSVADAKKAGLWGKGGPWTQYPKRMLAIRARSFALRDVFADVLGGLYVREEIEDMDEIKDITPPPAAVEPEEVVDAAPEVRKGRAKREKKGDGARDAAAYAEPAAEEPPPVVEEEPEVEESPIPAFVSTKTGDDVLAEFRAALMEATSLRALAEVWDQYDDDLRELGVAEKASESYQQREAVLKADRERKVAAWEAGKVAYARGRSVNLVEAPYSQTPDEADAWVKGWRKAEELGPPPQIEPEPAPEPEGPEPASEEELNAAYQMGRAARRSGMSQRAVPPEFRTPEKEGHARAWKEGYADEMAEASAA